MKLIAATATLGLVFGLSAPALADHHEPAKPEVVEVNEQGQPTKVKIGENVIDVCLTDDQDSCINPRDAGLDFGNRELSYWPGRPASEIDEPLPWDPPAEEEPAETPANAEPE